MHTLRAGLLVSLGTSLLGACTLDTAPEALPSRASALGQAEAESSSLDTPSQLEGLRSTAGAAAPAPATKEPAPQPSAAVISASPSIHEQAEPEQAEPEQAEPEQAEPEQAEPEREAMAAAADTKPEPEPEREQPSDKSACKPGDYEGVISGTVNLGPLEVSTLTGKMSLRLVADAQNNDRLRVQQGRIEGVDLNDSVFSADLSGEVDCATGELVRSEVERGMYEDPTEIIRIGFTGAAEGRYTADPPALLGTWSISDATSVIAGQGTWTTKLAEPLE
jgi:hypothetical protein